MDTYIHYYPTALVLTINVFFSLFYNYNFTKVMRLFVLVIENCTVEKWWGSTALKKGSTNQPKGLRRYRLPPKFYYPNFLNQNIYFERLKDKENL